MKVSNERLSAARRTWKGFGMSYAKQQWSERQICQAFNLTREALHCLIMEGIIPPPHRTFTGQFVYTEVHASRLSNHLHLEQLVETWILDPDNMDLQVQINQDLSLQSPFRNNNWQGLYELWEYESLSPETIRGILTELIKLDAEEDLFQEVIALLFEKTASHDRKRYRP